MSVTSHLAADFTEVPLLCARLRGFVQDRLTEEQIVKIDIGLAEIINNVIEHGYRHDRSRTLTVRCRWCGGTLIIMVSDTAPAFQPRLGDVLPEVSIQLHDLRTRGRGLWLIRQCFEGSRFQRRHGRNRVTVWLHSTAIHNRSPP